MNLSEWIRMLYGLTLGTSTPLIDIGARPLRPLQKTSLESDLTAYVGGSTNCVAVANGEKVLLINTNMGKAAEEIMHQAGLVTHIVNQKAHPYFAAGNELFTEARDIFVGDYPRPRLIEVFGDRKVPSLLISETTEVKWGNETIVIDPIKDGMFAKNLVVYLQKAKTLMLGDLFYNKVYPIFKMHGRLDVAEWMSQLERILSKYQPERIIPAEGALATAKDVGIFIEFLRDVSRAGAKSSNLSEKYQWEAIAGLSSLEKSVEAFKHEH
jgi:hypothetical protein